MSIIDYAHLSDVNPIDFLPILNKPATRTHLIEHRLFTEATVTEWVESKIQLDQLPGCRIRAIRITGVLVGWCGIQNENSQYEMAIVLDDSHWGIGKRVFADMMHWAEELKHKRLVIHLLDTRRKYRSLRKMAKRVYATEMLGARFTTYELSINDE